MWKSFFGVPIHVVCTCSYFVLFLYAALLANNSACQAEGGKSASLFPLLLLHHTFVNLKDIDLFPSGRLS